MAEVHHFTYGAFNPVAAYLLAFLGSFFGLLCAVRARSARNRGRRTRWLAIAAFAIGGAATWLMHFVAMLGFDVPASPVRYDVAMTVASLACAVIAVAIGLMIVGHGQPRPPKILAAGLFTGSGILAMHYLGMRGLRFSGEIRYNPLLVVASAILAIAAGTMFLWFVTSARGWGRMGAAAAVMALLVCGMHYTGMAAVSVYLEPVPTGGIGGIRPLTMIVPITLITAAVIIGVALSGLQAMTEEEFTNGAGTPKRGVHADHTSPWSLRQASLSAARRTTVQRPSRRPLPVRGTTSGS